MLYMHLYRKVHQLSVLINQLKGKKNPVILVRKNTTYGQFFLKKLVSCIHVKGDITT